MDGPRAAGDLVRPAAVWARVWADAPESLVVVELGEIPDGTRVTITQGDFDSAGGAPPKALAARVRAGELA